MTRRASLTQPTLQDFRLTPGLQVSATSTLLLFVSLSVAHKLSRPSPHQERGNTTTHNFLDACVLPLHTRIKSSVSTEPGFTSLFSLHHAGGGFWYTTLRLHAVSTAFLHTCVASTDASLVRLCRSGLRRRKEESLAARVRRSFTLLHRPTPSQRLIESTDPRTAPLLALHGCGATLVRLRCSGVRRREGISQRDLPTVRRFSCVNTHAIILSLAV